MRRDKARRVVARLLDTVPRVSDTQSESVQTPRSGARTVAGAIVIFSDDHPVFAPTALVENVPVRWGKGDVGGVNVDDGRMSQAHLEVRFAAGLFHLEDLGSRNGTTVDGKPLSRGAVPPGAVVRMGRTLVLLVADLAPYAQHVELVHEALGAGPKQPFVIGPLYRAALERIASARARGSHLVILGETGCGKEYAAHHFHRAAARPGPFTAVNAREINASLGDVTGTAANIATGVKERAGLVELSSGGVLFFDEFAEMSAEVQAQLLRIVQSGEVRRAGAAQPTRVDVQYLCASHQSMSDRVARGEFREDLFYRLRQVEVRVPPLRERKEEIPWLLDLDARAEGMTVHSSAVEAVLLRPWRGNLRDLRRATREAIGEARAAGKTQLREAHFSFVEPGAGATAPEPQRPTTSTPPTPRKDYSRDELLDALTQHAWNISRTATALDLWREQLKRLMRKHGLEKPGGGEGDDA